MTTAQAVEPSPEPPAQPSAAATPNAEPTPDPTSEPEATLEPTASPEPVPVTIEERVNAEIDSVPSAPRKPHVDVNPEAGSPDGTSAELPKASVEILEPGEEPDRSILTVEVPSDEDLVAEVAGLPVAGAGRPDLVLSETETVDDDSRVVVQTLPLDGSLPGAVVAFRVRALDAADDDAWAQLTLDSSELQGALGADYADRLQLVEFPACALTTPEIASCVRGHDLDSATDAEEGSASAFVELATPDFVNGAGGIALAAAGEGSIIAAVSGASGASGTFTATDLGTESQWAVSEQHGAFTYSVPLAIPEVAVGNSPSLSVGYNSGAVDGQGIATNNQPSWTGQGWSLGTAYIERLYKSCYSDGYTARASELCWDSPYTDVGEAAYVISFGGSTQDLIWEGDNRYRTASDTGWRITRHARGADTNGDNNGEYFKLMTPDGSTYYFGYGTITETGQTSQDTDSVATVPVYGDDSGEPRCSGTAQSNYCRQAYRWMVDIEKDPNENVVAYFYAQEKNRYSLGGDPAKPFEYTSNITPLAITYGSSSSAMLTGPTAKVVFSVKARCVATADGTYDALAGDSVECESATQSNASQYPDAPLDLRCTSTCTSAQDSPVFFTTKRVNHVSGYVKNTSGGWSARMRNQFEFAYPATSDGGARALWLDTIQTRYYGASSAQADVTDYVYDFDGINLKNRVDYTTSVRYMDKRRLAVINTPEGLDVEISYVASGGRHCPTGGSASSAFDTWYPDVDGKWDTNNWDCFPQLFTNSSGSTGFAIFHKYLVDKVVLDDMVKDSPDRTIQYTYVGTPAWGYGNNILFARGTGNQTWNSWRGYAKVEVTTGSGANESTTLTQYYRGMQDDWLVGGAMKDVTVTPMNNDQIGLTTTVPDYYSRMGRVVATRTYDQDRTLRAFTQDELTGATEIDGPSLHNSVWLDTSRTYDGTRIVNASGGLVKYLVGRTTTAYDTYHRPDTVTSEPDQDVATWDSCTKYSYVHRVGSDDIGYFTLASTTPWGSLYYMWRESSIKTYDGSCSGVQTGRTDLYYDGETSLTAQMPFDGNVTKQVDYSTATASAASAATYDGRGRITSATLPDGTSKSTWAYSTDSAGLNVTTFTNALGQTETAWSEPTFGREVKVKHLNGLYDHYTYDAGGRALTAYAAEQYGADAAPAATVKPTTIYVYDGSVSTLERRTTAPWSRVQTLKDYDGNGDSMRSYTYLDGFGNDVQSFTVSQDATNGRSVVTKTYDSVGNLTRVTAPFYNAEVASTSSNPIPFVALDTPSYTYTEYDWAGRPTSVQQKSLSTGLAETTSKYLGDKTIVTTPASTTETVVDPAGRTVSTLTGAESGAYTKATYAYATNADGTSTVSVKDAGNVPTTFTSDWLGRTTTMGDPNSGSTAYLYDTNGKVSKVTSQAGVVDTTYDKIGRALTRTARTAAGEPAQSTTTWTYDTLGSISAVGQLLKTVHSTSAGTYTTQVAGVDAAKRPTSTTATLPNNAILGEFSNASYTSAVTYDTSGRVLTATLPAVAGVAGDTVTTGYAAWGTARTLASAAEGTILSGVTRTFDGRVTNRTLANGVTRSIVWDENYRRVTSTGASRTGAAVQSDVYAYDTAGRVSSIADEVQGIRQCYAYDAVNRLSAAWTAATTCGNAVPTDSSWNVAGKASSYRNTWSYAATGQVSSATAATAATPTPATTSYTYGNTAHPNAAMATAGGTTGAFVYDAAGRMTSRTVNGTAQTLAWDVLSNLSSIVQGGTTTYLYDASGQRFAAISGSSATVYMGAWEATDPNTASTSTGDVTVTRYYSAGGVQLASKTTGSPLSVSLGDVQGSAQAAVDSTGAVTRNAYTPYGTERSGSSIASAHGWLNQVADTTGLTYLNARYYDPLLARFLSPDPLMNAGDPRTLDPYRYADNNPVTYSDSTGLAPSCAGATGSAYTNCMNYASGTYNYATGKSTKQERTDRAHSNSPAPKVSRGYAGSGQKRGCGSASGQCGSRASLPKGGWKAGDPMRGPNTFNWGSPGVDAATEGGGLLASKYGMPGVGGALVGVGGVTSGLEGYYGPYKDRPQGERVGWSITRGLASAAGGVGGGAVGGVMAPEGGPFSVAAGSYLGGEAAEAAVDYVATQYYTCVEYCKPVVQGAAWDLREGQNPLTGTLDRTIGRIPVPWVRNLWQ